jgi:hypothetical protein
VSQVCGEIDYSSDLSFSTNVGAGGKVDDDRLAKHVYGRYRNQKVIPSVEAETIYGKLLVIAASADGRIAEKERQWILNSRAAHGK